MLRMDKNMDRITQQYRLWLEKADKDHELLQELKSMEDSPQKIQDAFSDMSGMAALTTDRDGVPVTQGSNFTEFLKLQK